MLLVFVWAVKDRVAFYSAMYEGRRAIGRHEYPAAKEAFERAWRYRPEHPYIYDSAGFLFLNEAATGWKAKVRENYAKAATRGLKSNPFINHVREARRLLDQGQYEQADIELTHALELFPRDATANLLAGHLLYAQGKLNKAIDQYQKALAISPGSDECRDALTRSQESRTRGSLPYILDRQGTVLAAQDVITGLPSYPCDFWTAHIIGYRSADHGAAGLEAAMEPRLKGNTVTLTIDAHIQRVADAALGWQKGAVVIIKPQTGEILAIVSHPTFRPSQIDKTWRKINENINEPLKNRALERLYEPGSIAKIISSAAMIESRTDISKLYPFKCRGYLMIGESLFSDWKAHGNIPSFKEAFDNSCNVAMGRMAPLVGAANLTQFLRSFGFAEQDRITLDLPVAVSHAPLDPDTPMKLANAFIGLGNNFRITPLHAAMIAAAVANGGVMMAPSLVREIRSTTGTVILQASPKVYKISMKKETADALTDHMVDFVTNGIGKKARMIRYHVAGKTGTSGSSKNGLHGWFICFAPAEKPQLAVAILCENGGTGHAVAAPIAQRIFAEALR
jgi:peptidoglycan glycosyltransferase